MIKEILCSEFPQGSGGEGHGIRFTKCRVLAFLSRSPPFRRSTQFLCKRERPPPGEPEKKNYFSFVPSPPPPRGNVGREETFKKARSQFLQKLLSPSSLYPFTPYFLFLKKILRFHPLHFRRETAGRGRRTFKRETPPFPKQEYALFQWSATRLKKLYGLDCQKKVFAGKWNCLVTEIWHVFLTNL